MFDPKLNAWHSAMRSAFFFHPASHGQRCDFGCPGGFWLGLLPSLDSGLIPMIEGSWKLAISLKQNWRSFLNMIFFFSRIIEYNMNMLHVGFPVCVHLISPKNTVTETILKSRFQIETKSIRHRVRRPASNGDWCFNQLATIDRQFAEPNFQLSYNEDR